MSATEFGPFPPEPGYALFLDDERMPESVTWVKLPEVDWVIVRSLEAFAATITERGLPSLISFDHDLGERDGHVLPNGKECANWLVEYCLDNEVAPPPFFVHSKNPQGVKNIEGLLDGLHRHFGTHVRPRHLRP